MVRSSFILAFSLSLLAAGKLQAQVSAAPSTSAADAIPAGTSAATAAAEKTEVPFTAEQPAPVTAPGAPITETAPLAPAGQVSPQGQIQPAATKVARGAFEADPDAYSVVGAGKGLSLHKPMFLLPYTYSPTYHGKNTEVVFDISFKQRIFGLPLYVAYSQKSFWQAYYTKHSSPFRENDYNPEIFYRFIPADRERWFHLGADLGFEHESNGRSLPDSRSWNRVYLAFFQAEDQHLIYWKWWYRLPEDKSKPVTDPERDDNPDIQSYYGYSELTYEQQLFDKQLARFTVRYNPVTERSSVNFQYSIPNSKNDPNFFWMFYLFQGYGESLLDYNHSVFRVGLGVALAR